MKRILIGIIMLTVCAAGCHFVTRSLNKSIEELCNSVSLCLNAVEKEDRTSLVFACENASRLWEEHKGIFSSMTNHTEFEALSMGLSQLPYLAHKGKTDEVEKTALECKLALKELSEAQRITLDNIF